MKCVTFALMPLVRHLIGGPALSPNLPDRTTFPLMTFGAQKHSLQWLEKRSTNWVGSSFLGEPLSLPAAVHLGRPRYEVFFAWSAFDRE